MKYLQKFVIVFLLCTLLSSCGRKGVASENEHLQRGQQIGLMLIMYDREHGSFPDELSELVSSGIATQGEFDQLAFPDGDWIYLPENADNFGSAILVAPTELRPGQRILVTRDGAAKGVRLEDLPNYGVSP
jgi:hypothetical protein